METSPDLESVPQTFYPDILSK